MMPKLHLKRALALAPFALLLLGNCSAPADGEPTISASPIAAPPLAARAASNPGDSCSGPGDCASGFCVDGVCCSTKCHAGCQACSASKKQSGTASGTCGPRKAGMPPQPPNLCPIVPGSICAKGTCNGVGACGAAPDTPCGVVQCQLGDTQSAQPTCGATAACDSSIVTSCGAFLCDDVSHLCPASCTSTAQCQPNHYCRGGACLPTHDNGMPCSDDEQCTNGNCYVGKGKVSGVCCDSDCAQPCYSCYSSEQAQPKHGSCRAVKANADPNDDCAPGTDVCKGRGVCAGNGACETQTPDGTVCGDQATCSVNGETATVVATKQCATGACVAGSTTYACEGVSKCNASGNNCLEKCSSNADCQSTYYCQGGTCLERSGIGTACGVDSECLSEHCTDGVCCDLACDGQCEACDVAQNEGSCTTLAAGSTPRGTRAPCPGAGSSGNACAARVCDGKPENRKVCEGFADDKTVCAPANCAEDALGSTYTPPSTCDGKGSCELAKPIPCGAFTCSNGCGTSCTAQAAEQDCVESAQCAGDKCVLTPRCLDDAHATPGDGTVEDCAPYVCTGSACLETCSSSEECVGGARCDAATRTCVADANSQSDPGDPGCGCRTGRQPKGPPGTLWLLGLATFALRRRRHA